MASADDDVSGLAFFGWVDQEPPLHMATQLPTDPLVKKQRSGHRRRLPVNSTAGAVQRCPLLTIDYLSQSLMTCHEHVHARDVKYTRFIQKSRSVWRLNRPEANALADSGVEQLCSN